MRRIDEFMKHIENHDQSFFCGSVMFVKARIGSGFMVYAEDAYSVGQEAHATLNEKLELIAVVTKHGQVFIVDDYTMGLYKLGEDNSLPEGVARFFDEVKRTNQLAEEIFFPSFFKSLPIEEDKLDSWEKQRLQDIARKKLLGLQNEENEKKPLLHEENFFSGNDTLKILLDLLSFEQETKKRLEEKRDSWIGKKTRDALIEKYMQQEDLALPYERQMAAALHGVDAKTVTVEFILNDASGTIKVEKQTLLRMLDGRDYFSYFNFANGKEGKELIRKLNAAHYRGEKGKEALTCEHIQSITYGKKTIFKRES